MTDAHMLCPDLRFGSGQGARHRPVRAPQLRLDRAGLLVALATLCFLLSPASSPTPADAAAAPDIAASWVTDVTASSANLRAQVNPEGLATSYRFEYLTEAAYAANLAAAREAFFGASLAPPAGGSVGSGSTTQNLLQHLQGLAPSTAYRYRITASNSAGPAIGPTRPLETEQTAPVFSLPDNRGWEMVSPVDKNGGQIQGFGANFGGDTLQAAEAGGEVTYSSSSSFGQGAQGAPAASQYLGGREASSWSTNNVTPPQRSSAEPSPGAGVPFRLFSPDLAKALIYSGGSCLKPNQGCANPSPPLAGSGAPSGYQDYYLRNDANGSFQALLTNANTPALTLSAEAFSVSLAGTTPDLGHVVLSTCAKLTVEATEVTEGPACNQGERNLYEWSGGALRLINLLPGNTTGTPGALLAAQSNAISADGNRVYFTELEDGGLYLREGNATKSVPETVGGAGSFQTASADGAAAFFLKGAHLYRYLAASEAVTDLTPAGEVQGVLGASADGSYLYFQTASGLQLWHSGTTTPIASGAALPGSYPPATGSARVSADGIHLAFLSNAPLTGFDNLDANTKAPDAELYLYDANSGRLLCASCNPTGERPVGPASIPGAIANGIGALATQAYKPRVLAAGGNRLFFDSADALALQDTNNRADVYQWEAQGAGSCAKAGGCISLISSGRDGEPSAFIDASASGADAFFLTAASLVPSDPGSFDLYDARAGGGFAIPPTPIPCTADACQPLPSAPEDPTPGTLVGSPGNPAPHFLSEGGKKKHHHHKKKKHHKGKKHNGGKK
jgi:dipeptidyl aminopeptidase/acylaminoacyl peptidase